MRCLGEIVGRKPTEAFVAYLLTQGISTHVDKVGDGQDRWEIWVRDEDKLGHAKRLLDDFHLNPADSKYLDALKDASRILTEKARQQESLARNVRKVQYNLGPLRDRRIPPLTLTLVILSCIVSLLSNFGQPGPSNEIGITISEQLSFVSRKDYIKSGELQPDGQGGLSVVDGDPAASLKKGQVWRAISPIFLHGTTIHLAFNMLSLVVLGRIVERWLGTPRYALFCLVAAILSNLLQGLSPEWMRGTPFFGGISGVVYALFGYVWIRSILNPMLGVSIPAPIIVLLLAPLVIGFSGIAKDWRFADLAHLGGLVVGIAVAWLQEKTKR